MQSVVIRIILIAMGIVIQAGTLYALFSAHQDLGATKVQVQDLTLRLSDAEGRLTAVQASVAKVIAQSNKLNTEVQHALSKNPIWADTPVPVDIGTSLCQFATCRKNQTSPVHAPGD